MIRLGIAGIGTIARDYIGLIVAGCIKDVELTALCSRSDVSMHRLQAQYSLSAKAFQDYQTMLDSGVMDAVLITTPHGLHPEMAIQAVFWSKSRWVSTVTRWSRYLLLWKRDRRLCVA